MDQKPEYKAEIDFRDLVRKPVKLFGYSYFYVLLVLLGLGILYVQNLTQIGKNKILPVVLKDSSAFVQDIAFQSPRVSPPVDVMKASVSSAQMVAKGKDLYKTTCASCHGDNGMGDGPAGIVLNPRPRNFHTLTGWTNGSKLSQIYKTLQEGIVKNGMASYNYLPPDDRFALIHYVRNFVNGHPQDSPQEIQALETTYQLSKGSNIPGQIPVKKAAQIIEQEFSDNGKVIDRLSSASDGLLQEKRSELFRRVARDKKRIFTMLVHSEQELATVNRFIKIISADPVQLGFNGEVLQLSSTDWNLLYQYVSGLKIRKG
ncbi:MAG: cytochrome c [bacterium]